MVPLILAELAVAAEPWFAATVQHAVGISSEQAVSLGLNVNGRVIEGLF